MAPVAGTMRAARDAAGDMFGRVHTGEPVARDERQARCSRGRILIMVRERVL